MSFGCLRIEYRFNDNSLSMHVLMLLLCSYVVYYRRGGGGRDSREINLFRRPVLYPSTTSVGARRVIRPLNHSPTTSEKHVDDITPRAGHDTEPRLARRRISRARRDVSIALHDVNGERSDSVADTQTA
jgi:hypothetical protein